jgi:hypothetical protein
LSFPLHVSTATLWNSASTECKTVDLQKVVGKTLLRFVTVEYELTDIEVRQKFRLFSRKGEHRIKEFCRTHYEFIKLYNINIK